MLFEELGKIKRSTIMTAILAAVTALVMIMCPPAYMDAFVAVLGYVLIILATVWILQFISGKKSLINYCYLTGALLTALLGIGVLVFSEDMMLIISIVFGLVLIIDGIVSMTNAFVYARRAQRKGWWVLIVLSLLLLAAGLIVMINPWWKEPAELFDVVGFTLLFSALVSTIRLFLLWPIRND